MQHEQTRSQTATTYDEGLRSYFIRVYNVMGLGLFITGIMAWFSSQNEAMLGALIAMHQNPIMGFIISFSPMILASFMFSPAAMRKFSANTLTIAFLAFSAYLGWLLSTLFLVYTGASIARVFFITSATFLSMSLWGYTTKKDLSSMGSMLAMGMIGLLIAIVVNFFMQSAMMQFIISGAGVLIFTLMIAYDTQNIKEMYNAGHNHETNTKLALLGSFSLYMNFIMLFQFLMQFLGQRD